MHSALMEAKQANFTVPHKLCAATSPACAVGGAATAWQAGKCRHSSSLLCIWHYDQAALEHSCCNTQLITAVGIAPSTPCQDEQRRPGGSLLHHFGSSNTLICSRHGSIPGQLVNTGPQGSHTCMTCCSCSIAHAFMPRVTAGTV